MESIFVQTLFYCKQRNYALQTKVCFDIIAVVSYLEKRVMKLKKTRKFIFSFVGIALVVLVQLVMLFNGYRSIEPDILMVNEVASIRGFVQRYSKLVVVGFRDQQIEEKIDKLIQPNTSSTERAPKKLSSETITSVGDLQKKWEQLKTVAKQYVISEREKEKQNLMLDVINISEELWEMGDKLVLQSQSVSQNKLYYFRILGLAILLSVLILFVLVLMFKGIVNNLEEDSTYDSLTRAFNRRYFEFALDQEISRVNRKKGKFSIITMDIDHFKKINDTYGHMTGDRVLRMVSALITETVRKADVFARVGGEEFVCILPDTASEAALLTAERLRKLIEAKEVKELPKVTMSFGVTEYIFEESSEDLLKRVDAALYEAKEKGRNQCVLKV